MKTIWVSIGNSDNKLTQADWVAFLTDVRNAIRLTAVQMHAEAHSAPDVPWQNAHWCFKPNGDAARAFLREHLATIAFRYSQDSIAWLEGDTEFIKAGME